MIEIEFQSQMKRLITTYGPSAYPEERCRIIWREMGTLFFKDFIDIVDRLIAEEARPPMIDKFRECATSAREKRWAEEKKKQDVEAAAFWSNMPSDEMRNICEGIRDRLSGAMSDEDFKGFRSVLKKIEDKS